ncbi:MAG TPA: GatB/YqeY domain-containing protein [Ktedonobacterales bacterium]|nr:GatB/YqeY domain-containing protein [Ktedonobacterales bacterium]
MTEQQQTTSALEQSLRADVKESMRAHDQVRVDTLRIALSAFHLEEVARTDEKHRQFRLPLTEQDRVSILEKQIKQRDEAAQIYRKAGRAEQAEKEEREAALLKAYLPAQMSDDEIRALVSGLVAERGKDFRAVMPLASRETKGRADGKRVSEIVRELTA